MKRVFARLARVVRSEQSGQALVELLVAMGIAALLLPAMATAMVAARGGRAQLEQRMQATTLLREANEAVRSVREKGWTQFATNGTFRPAISGNTWSFTAGAETVNGFTRQIVVSDAQRNSGGAIVTSGGTVDPSTKRVVVTVSWTQPVAASVSNESYFHRYLGNSAWTQTTQAEFAAGTETNVTATSTSGGTVELTSTPGSFTWTSASLVGMYDVPSSTADAEDVDVDAVNNRAFLAVGSTLRIINISNPAAPTLIGTYTASGIVNGVRVSGNFVYLSTAADTAELTVVDIANPASPSLEATLNLGGTADATKIHVSGTRAYVGKVASGTAGDNELYIINITTPASPAVLGSLNQASTVNSVFVSGNFAYLASSNTAAELTIANVTNPASPTQAGTYNPSGTSIGNDVYAVGTTVYLAKSNNTSGGELFIVNAANAASPALLGTYEMGGNIWGVVVANNTAFLSTALASNYLRILNVANPASISVLRTVNLGGIGDEIAYAGDDKVYAATAHDTRELAIVQGSSTPGGYQTSGTFESSSFDAGASAAYNYVTFTLTEPASTSIRFQIAVNNNNSTWSYVGPDGTAATFYDTPQAIRLGTAGRYLRYRATFSGPGTSTPVLSDIAVNYSP